MENMHVLELRILNNDFDIKLLFKISKMIINYCFILFFCHTHSNIAKTLSQNF